MTLSIRARLTLWYSSILVLVLVTAAVVGSLAQSRLAVQSLDEDLLRTMATLEGVMRTEFGEGLSLEAAAGEASAEVVAPDRTLALTRTDGTVLQVWGLPIDRDAVSSIGSIAGPSTVRSVAGDLRALRHHVEYERNTYIAIVMAM
jgi:hypothetical protein